MTVRSITDCVLMTLNGNDNDDVTCNANIIEFRVKSSNASPEIKVITFTVITLVKHFFGKVITVKT